MKKFLVIFSLVILITAFTSLDDAGKVLRNEKIKTTDEFLIKKREPLVLPPDFKELPEPGSISSKKRLEEKEKIKKILNANEEIDSSKSTSSNIEESILEKVRK